jgi:hypothetical protein
MLAFRNPNSSGASWHAETFSPARRSRRTRIGRAPRAGGDLGVGQIIGGRVGCRARAQTSPARRRCPAAVHFMAQRRVGPHRLPPPAVLTGTVSVLATVPAPPAGLRESSQPGSALLCRRRCGSDHSMASPALHLCRPVSSLRASRCLFLSLSLALSVSAPLLSCCFTSASPRLAACAQRPATQPSSSTPGRGVPWSSAPVRPSGGGWRFACLHRSISARGATTSWASRPLFRLFPCVCPAFFSFLVSCEPTARRASRT